MNLKQILKLKSADFDRLDEESLLLACEALKTHNQNTQTLLDAIRKNVAVTKNIQNLNEHNLKAANRVGENISDDVRALKANDEDLKLFVHTINGQLKAFADLETHHPVVDFESAIAELQDVNNLADQVDKELDTELNCKRQELNELHDQRDKLNSDIDSAKLYRDELVEKKSMEAQRKAAEELKTAEERRIAEERHRFEIELRERLEQELLERHAAEKKLLLEAEERRRQEFEEAARLKAEELVRQEIAEKVRLEAEERRHQEALKKAQLMEEERKRQEASEVNTTQSDDTLEYDPDFDF